MPGPEVATWPSGPQGLWVRGTGLCGLGFPGVLDHVLEGVASRGAADFNHGIFVDPYLKINRQHDCKGCFTNN